MASPIDPRLWALIKQYSTHFRLDPYAVAAVSLMEGGGRFGAVGDNNSSFGPFQLHVGGALPAGRDAAWANSPQGVYYAMQQMARSGAAGRQGAAAIRAIVSRFERPAAPGPEISGAIQHYQELNGRNLHSTPYAHGRSPGATTLAEQAMATANRLLAGMSPVAGGQPYQAASPAAALQALYPGTATSPPTPDVVNPVNAELTQTRTDDALAATQRARAGLLPTMPAPVVR